MSRSEEDTVEELKPCPTPWCDGKEGGPQLTLGDVNSVGAFCMTCSVSTPFFPTSDQAIKCWNTRSSPEVVTVTEEMIEAATAYVASNPFRGASSGRDWLSGLYLAMHKVSKLSPLVQGDNTSNA